MSRHRTAFAACALLLAAAGCSSSEESPTPSASTPSTMGSAPAAACLGSDDLLTAINGFESVLVVGATETTLDAAQEPIDAAVDALEATVPVDQRDAYRAVELAEESLDSALDRLPEAGAYSQEQIDSVADEAAALRQTQLDLATALGC